MKIKIEIPYSHFLIVNPDNDSGVLLKALANAQLVTSEGYGKDIKWKAADQHQKISFEVVDDAFLVTPHDAVQQLTKSVETATNNWLKEYTAKNNAEAELKALQTKIKDLGLTIE